MLILEGNEGYGLLIEEFHDSKIITSIDEVTKEKHHYIEGIFSKTDEQLRNPRTYSKPLMEREETKFQQIIKEGKSWGEFEHPPHRHINGERICLAVKELVWEGKYLMGKAMLLDTPHGKIVKALCEGGKPGVSSRGTGSVKNGKVQNDYELITWDVVLDPSVGESAMTMIRERFDFLLNNGVNEQALDELKHDIKMGNINRKEFNKNLIERFTKLINNI